MDQTLRGGTQTLGNLFDLPALPLVAALRERIAEAVTRTVHALAERARNGTVDDPTTHPLLARAAQARSGGWRFTDSWSSRLLRGGFHTHHVHPHGWLSSACYVSVPPSVAAGDAGGHAGWLQFGQPDRDLGLAPLRHVQPRVGRLVLFPSYLWHGTLPFDDDAERLTVAFDVMPR
ncbi:MAG: hypothetical protein KIT17_10160 [Rubrivivax sp.]|nr:hypothetical protein [Rubrivivax sp.]